MKKKPRNILHYTQNSIIRWHLLLLEELSLNDKKKLRILHLVHNLLEIIVKNFYCCWLLKINLKNPFHRIIPIYSSVLPCLPMFL